MGRHDWYRRDTWTDADREAFDARLSRSRGAGNKAQYLRIQALHLAEAGRHESAIELLDRLFAEHPVRTELASSHLQKAHALAALGDLDGAVAEFRAALQTERTFSSVRTNAWLDFGWLVVVQQLTTSYDEAARVLAEFRDEESLKFPLLEYRYFAIQALLAEARGENDSARELAERALAEGAKTHSGLRHHPHVALVNDQARELEPRLRALADR